MSSGQEPIRRRAARQRRESEAHTALATPYEERHVWVAQGLDFHNSDLPPADHDRIPADINSRPRGSGSLDLRFAADGTCTYTSHEQHVHFIVHPIVTEKQVFIEKLMVPGVMVIYDGHARYGRGPCFGDVNAHGAHPDGIADTTQCPQHGDDWENGSDATRYGLFRMGYPYLELPMTEILHHGYRTQLVEASVPIKSASMREQIHPDVRAMLSRYDTYTIAELQQMQQELRDAVRAGLDRRPGAEHSMPEDLEGVLTGGAPAGFGNQVLNRGGEGDRFWARTMRVYYRSLGRHFNAPTVLLKAGWQNTISAPSDLGAVTPDCKCFCHFGCSTFKHNYRITRFEKGWRRDGDNRYAYWTTNASGSSTTKFWLYRWFTYPRRNDFEAWADSLAYAVRKTNQDLDVIDGTYHII